MPRKAVVVKRQIEGRCLDCGRFKEQQDKARCNYCLGQQRVDKELRKKMKHTRV